MVIAETSKSTSLDTLDLKAQRARQRSFIKRRATQLVNGHPQRNRNMCTDLQRHWNRRRLRRLLLADHVLNSTTKVTNLKHRKLGIYLSIILSMVGAMLLVFWISCNQERDTVSSLVRQYLNKYQALVHNDLNYCDRSISLDKTFENLRKNVINQEMALNKLEQALINQTSFQPVVLVGSSGVGKSLTMSMLLAYYPWPENIQSIVWNDFELIDEEARYKKISSMLGGLTHCGRNLFIIDNMFPRDLEYVSSINRLVRAHKDFNVNNDSPDMKHLTIVYIFNLNRMLPDEQYDRILATFEKLRTVNVITYRTFKSKDLESCVRHEAKLVDYHLDERYIDEIVSATNVKASGCKSVRSKILLYGYPELDDQD